MVEHDLSRRGITDRRVLAAFAAVPRELFVSTRRPEHAYEDCPLDIGHGQTISQPYIVARMLELAGLTPEGRVLDVGTGSGYAAALAGRLSREVDSIERVPQLARDAETRLADAGARNVRVHVGDGSLGLESRAPFDVILVAATAPAPPPALKRQLALGGRLVLPVGRPAGRQSLVRVTRIGPDTWREEVLDPVRFVPLIGQEGWDGDSG